MSLDKPIEPSEARSVDSSNSRNLSFNEVVIDLTGKLEKGDGCAAKSQLDNTGLNDRLRILKAIEQQNALNRESNKDLPAIRVYLSSNAQEGRYSSRLETQVFGDFAEILYENKLSFKENSSSCKSTSSSPPSTEDLKQLDKNLESRERIQKDPKLYGD